MEGPCGRKETGIQDERADMETHEERHAGRDETYTFKPLLF